MDYEENPDYNTKEPLVIVKPKAYLKMMKHVLRFGSMAMDKSQYRECMGMLMGKLGRQKGAVKDVIITDAVSVTNGSHIEVKFDDMDYVNFADINAEYAEKGEGVFNVRWYHSHPGLSVFLSTVDVNNHLGFQTTNPSAIAIVWDHQLLEQKDEEGNFDIGFETFRLTEIGKGKHSDYKTVKTIVEPPEDPEFYKMAIKEVIDLQHGGHPPIFEISELPSIVGDFQPTPVDPEDFQPNEVLFDISNDEQITNLNLSSQFVKPLEGFINSYSEQLSSNMKNQSVLLYRNLKKLRDSVEKKVEGLQKWFKNRINEVFFDIWADVDTPLEDQIKNMEPIIDNLQKKLGIEFSEDQSLEEILDEIKKNQGGDV